MSARVRTPGRRWFDVPRCHECRTASDLLMVWVDMWHCVKCRRRVARRERNYWKRQMHLVT